jgi:hypothetical protein
VILDDASMVSSLVSNAPIAAAVIATVILFLRRQKEQGDEFRATLSQIIDTQSKRDQAMTDQVGKIAIELGRMSDQLSDHDRWERSVRDPSPNRAA